MPIQPEAVQATTDQPRAARPEELADYQFGQADYDLRHLRNHLDALGKTKESLKVSQMIASLFRMREELRASESQKK